MIERITIRNNYHMRGFELEHSQEGISIGEGSIVDSSLPAVQFGLIYDEDFPVRHDLYIESVGSGYDYYLMASYRDGQSPIYYDNGGVLHHRFLTVTTYPDGSYQGDFVYVEQPEKVVVENGQDTIAPYQAQERKA